MRSPAEVALPPPPVVLRTEPERMMARLRSWMFSLAMPCSFGSRPVKASSPFTSWTSTTSSIAFPITMPSIHTFSPISTPEMVRRCGDGSGTIERGASRSPMERMSATVPALTVGFQLI